MTRAAVLELCKEFDIRVIDKHRYPEPGETRAVATMERILRRYGEGHLRLVLSTMAETKGNQGLIDEISLWAVSDLILACPQWVENRTTEWLEAWDRIPIGQMTYVIQELRGMVPQRSALAGLLYSWLRAELDPEEGLTEHSAPRELARRMDESEIDKGRPALRTSYVHRSDFEKVAIGRALLDAKEKLPYRGFRDWIRQEAGMHLGTAEICMRAARSVTSEQANKVA